MKIKPRKQKDSMSCGPASIKMAVDYLNVPISLKTINEISNYKKKGGLYNKDLVQILETFNLKTKVLNNIAWANLIKYNKKKENVIIISWMLRGYIGHFSVIDKVTPTAIYIAEPESGKIIKFDKIIFLRLWFDYDPKWYPQKNSDISLRWMVVVTK